MFVDTFGKHISDLHDGAITHTEFLRNVNCYSQYKDWCEEHSLKPDEDNAELFFDMYGFEESEVTKEFIEPVS